MEFLRTNHFSYKKMNRSSKTSLIIWHTWLMLKESMQMRPFLPFTFYKFIIIKLSHIYLLIVS